MARVGVDIDGVIFDFQDSLRQWLVMGGEERELFGPAERWEFYEDWGMNVSEFVTICHAAADAGHLFSYGPAMDDAEYQVARLRQEGHKVIFITDRSFGSDKAENISEKMTIEWLKKHRIRYDEIHFTAQKDTVQVDYMIDDKPENYAMLLAKGTDVWIRDRPWNQGFDCYRVASLKRYVDYVIKKEKDNGFVKGLEPAVDALAKDFDVDRNKTAIADENMPTEMGPSLGFIEEVRHTSATGGQKGTKLARFDLIPTSPMWELAELYGKGAIKYADRNWELGYPWGESYAALQRHAQLFWAGESYDLHKDDCAADCSTHTLKHHLASVIFHCMALMEWERTHPEFDDRVK